MRQLSITSPSIARPRFLHQQRRRLRCSRRLTIYVPPLAHPLDSPQCYREHNAPYHPSAEGEEKKVQDVSNESQCLESEDRGSHVRERQMDGERRGINLEHVAFASRTLEMMRLNHRKKFDNAS